MKIKVIHQWRDWQLECVGVGQYSFIKKDNKTVVRTIVAKNDMDAENQCQRIINAAKKCQRLNLSVSVEALKVNRNDPCPCGSGIKFKKCYMDKKEHRSDTGLEGRHPYSDRLVSSMDR